MRFGGSAVSRAVQPAACDEHIANSRSKHDGAERREIEKPEARKARVFERAVGHEIRWRADEREHPADQPGKTQRHHQPPRRELLPLSDEQHHRDEDRNDAGRTHDRPQRRDGEHQKGNQPPFTARGVVNQEIANLHRDPRAHQPLADDEERRDEHDIRIAESRERLRHREHAAARERHQGEQRDHIQPRLVGDEKSHASAEQAEDEKQLRIHASATHAVSSPEPLPRPV